MKSNAPSRIASKYSRVSGKREATTTGIFVDSADCNNSRKPPPANCASQIISEIVSLASKTRASSSEETTAESIPHSTSNFLRECPFSKSELATKTFAEWVMSTSCGRHAGRGPVAFLEGTGRKQRKVKLIPRPRFSEFLKVSL